MGRLWAVYGAKFERILANRAIFAYSHMPGTIRSWTARYRSAVGCDGSIVERGGLITGTWNNYGGFSRTAELVSAIRQVRISGMH
jgi:hypothetical protein